MSTPEQRAAKLPSMQRAHPARRALRTLLRLRPLRGLLLGFVVLVVFEWLRGIPLANGVLEELPPWGPVTLVIVVAAIVAGSRPRSAAEQARHDAERAARRAAESKRLSAIDDALNTFRERTDAKMRQAAEDAAAKAKDAPFPWFSVIIITVFLTVALGIQGFIAGLLITIIMLMIHFNTGGTIGPRRAPVDRAPEHAEARSREGSRGGNSHD